MPRNWGVNPKAVEAKTRELEKKKDAIEKKQKEAEDAYWKDDDKNAQRKQQRKEDKQKKHDEEVRRREENRKLLEMESEQLKSAKSTSATQTRPTKAQIEAAREKIELTEKKKLGLVADVPSQSTISQMEATSRTQDEDVTVQKSATSVSISDSESEDGLAPLEENVNRILSLNQGDGSAHGVDQALVLLRDSQEPDAHPERRMKKAHLDFEAQMMARLKLENPNMRRSQLKEIIWREWQRAPQNPLNVTVKSTSD